MYIGSYATQFDYECFVDGPSDAYGNLEDFASPQGVLSENPVKLANILQAALRADLTECAGPEDEDQEFVATILAATWTTEHNLCYSVYTLKDATNTYGVVVVREAAVL